MTTSNSMLWHTDTLVHFNAKLYDGVLNFNNVASTEVCKKFQDMAYFGYEVERENPENHQKDTYFIQSGVISKFPIRVTDSEKFAYQNKVYRFVKAYDSVQIPSKKRMSFRELVDKVAAYPHSQPKEWLLFRIIMLASYIDRINVRVMSPASFGKDGVTDILHLLMGDVSNLYNATLGKLKYALKNNLIVLNELGGLKTEEIADMQIFLMQAGAYKPTYENNSRKIHGTKEVTDITDKSFVVFHNTPEYYTTKNQKYFEEMFTEAVIDRFPALSFSGYVEMDFSQNYDIDEVVSSGMETFKSVISTINYYRQNPIKEDKYSMDDSFWGFSGKKMQRALRSMKTLSKYIAEYSESKQEYQELTELLKELHYSSLSDRPVLVEELGVT